MIFSRECFCWRARVSSRVRRCSASWTCGISDLRFTVLMMGPRLAWRDANKLPLGARRVPERLALLGWTAEAAVPTRVFKKRRRHILLRRRLWKKIEPLLHGHADIIEVHVGEVPESVLMIVEVDADGLAFVRGQIIRHLCPGLSVGANLEDLRQHGAGSVLYLCLLPIVGDGVGCRRPVPEGESRLRRGAGDGDGLVEEIIAVRFGARTGAGQRAVVSAVLLHSGDCWYCNAAERPVSQSSGFESTVLDQLSGARIYRQGNCS